MVVSKVEENRPVTIADVSDLGIRTMYNQNRADMRAIRKAWVKAERYGDGVPIEEIREYRRDYEKAAKLSMYYLKEMESRRQAALTVLHNCKDPEVQAAVKTLKTFKI